MATHLTNNSNSRLGTTGLAHILKVAPPFSSDNDARTGKQYL